MDQNRNRNIVIGVIVAIVVIALLIWWFSAKSAAAPSQADLGMPAASSTGTGQTQAPAGTPVDGTPNANNSAAVSRSSDSVVAVAESFPEATKFASLLKSTGVSAQLNGKGPYTIFVPTDGAFSQMGSMLSGLSSVQLKEVIEYHVVSGRAIDTTALQTGTITALSGDPLNFSNDNNVPKVNSSLLVTRYNAQNGVVYEIGQVLMPPSKTAGTPTPGSMPMPN